MRSWMMILTALFCLNVGAEDLGIDKLLNASEAMNEEELVKAAEAMSKTEGGAANGGAVAASENSGLANSLSASSLSSDFSGGKENKALPESQIPVFEKSGEESKPSANHALRLVGSLLLLCVLVGGLIIWTRKRGFKRNTPGHNVRIEVLTQFHFGPKKGLAVVRVAGEVMLIGMTEHNINMIKPITLIDDEVEGLMGKDFNKFLADDFSIESVQNALNTPV